MKIQGLFLCFLWMIITTACIRSEAPNAEADILTCTVAGDVLKSDPEIDNESVTLIVKSDADITSLAPEFTLTPGATISPASGTTLDFSTDQIYVVTSEDKQWTKEYTVRCIVSGVTTEYHFELVTLDSRGRYQIFQDYTESGDLISWASGNAGYALTNSDLETEDFPTLQDEDGYVGKCAKMVTRSSGSFGELLGMPIAAGNLFIGTFDILNALSDARKATHFGRTFSSMPTYVSGYYKYTAGDVYERDGVEVSGEKDQFDIYGLFFETDDEVQYLDATNSFTSSNLIAVARISDQEEADEWTHFYIPFVYIEGKTVDKEKLANGEYYLALVFSSSINGDLFEGAVGSTLWIDEVEIISDDDEEEEEEDDE